jgi:alkylhydroperoxidase family enzyme
LACADRISTLRQEVPMPNIPYRTDFSDPDAAKIVAEIKLRRGGDLLNLDRMLMHQPDLAQGWSGLLGRIRKGYRISARDRELAICAVASLNGADYEFHHHAILLTAEGVSEAQIAALHDVETALADEKLFSPAERAVLTLTRDSTRHIKIGEETLAAVKAWFPDPDEVLELMMIIAAYNMVSRVLVGLGVEVEGEETSR